MALLLDHPLVVEVNTDDRAEYVLASRIRASYNRLTRRLILGRARALVFVTRELSESPSFRGFRAKHVVITNGIDLAEYPSLPAPMNDVPRLAFIGSPGQAWQGFDKVVRLARSRPAWQFEVVGSDDHWASPANVTWHGPLSREGVIDVLARCDVGIGTLALHRKGLDEASPLKVREYLAVGACGSRTRRATSTMRSTASTRS
jgi:glycosyltransferase involved in cell wall biosynthesis